MPFPFAHFAQTQPTMRRRSLALSQKEAAICIQKVIRGFLGRRRYKRIKKALANAAYQENFKDSEHLFDFRFKANGAVYKIQCWFRNLRYRRKRRWAKVHRRFIESLKQEKLLRRGFRKSGKYTYSRKDLTDHRIRMKAAATVICRVVRGFLGRRRFKRIKAEIIERMRIERENAIVIQTMVRKSTVRAKYPHIGKRYRMLQAKRIKWERANHALHKYVNNNRQYRYDEGISDEIQSETDSSASSVAGDETNELQHPRRLYVHPRFLARRPSFLFLHLRLGDAAYVATLHAPATIIQCMWRCFKARKRAANRRKGRKFRSMAVISAWLVRIYNWRRKVKAARVIQPVWKKQVQWRREKRACCIRIQSAWRAHNTRKHFQRLLKRRYYSTLKLVQWSHRLLCRKAVRAQLARLRQLAESRSAGLSCYTATHTRWMAHYMWQGVKVKNYTSQHEMQKVFVVNSVNGGMESAKFLKLAKECNGLLSDTLSTNQVEIQFTKVKNPLEKRIDYGKFIELCINLAVLKFMGVDPGRTVGGGGALGADDAVPTTTATVTAGTAGAASGTASGATAATITATGTAAGAAATSDGAGADGTAADNKANIATFIYAGQRGKAALITRFIAEFMVSVPDFKRAVEYLDSKQLSAGALTRILVRDNVTTIQRFVRNRFAVRKITADLVIHKADKVARRRTRAAQKIQGCIRGFLGRRLIKRMAQTMYTKFIHGETEREYWTNPRTNTSYWVKPRLLGEFDCGMATRMPTDDERYVVMCSSCERVSSTCYCLQCAEPYCTMCYAVGHRSGQRKEHHHLLVDNCVQCEFQIGTRYCSSCKDCYCDSCYRHMHRRGRLRFHVSKRNVDACDSCADLSAQWVETLVPAAENNFRRSKNWCNRCYRDEKGMQAADAAALKPPTLVRLPFYGRTVQQYKEKHDKERRAAEIAASFENRKRELHRMKVEKAARFVQRVYRGYRKRLEIFPFLEERREFMRLRYEEAAERDKLWYRLSTALGIGKALKSDTPLERVMKLYPAYMHHILALCVNNNWTYACKLLAEHEERLKRAPPSNPLQRMGAKLAVSWHTYRHKGAEKAAEKAGALYGQASQSLSRAQASGALAPKKLEALKASTAKAEATYREAQKQQMASEARLQEAQNRLTDCVGPRGIQKLVEEKRKNGILLPFRITLRRHSRLALVTAWEDDFDKTEEELAQQPARTPGKWKQYLQASDAVRILGVNYIIAQPPPVIGKKVLAARPSSASSDRSSDSEGGGKDKDGRKADDNKEAGADASGGNTSGSGGTKKRRRKLARPTDDSSGAGSKKKKAVTGTVRPDSALSEGSESSADHSGSDHETSGSGAKKSNTFQLELEIRETATEDHITLDHPWLLPDCYNVECYKILPHIFYYKPLFFLKRQFIGTYPVQKAAAIAAITLHKYASFLTWLQSSFDDESDAFASLQAKINNAQQSRDAWLALSRTIVQMSYDFTLRRQVFSLLYKFFGATAKTVKFLRSLVKNAAGGKAESAFDYWKRSMEKVDVVCILDKGNGRTETIGEFKLDLKAPCDIMREIIRRAFRTQLNASIGESFLFFKVDPDTAEEEILLRENEFKTYSKTFCFEKTDAKTMVTSMAILIIPDPQRGRVLIPEFAAETEEDQEQGEMQELLVSTKA